MRLINQNFALEKRLQNENLVLFSSRSQGQLAPFICAVLPQFSF